MIHSHTKLVPHPPVLRRAIGDSFKKLNPCVLRNPVIFRLLVVPLGQHTDYRPVYSGRIRPG